MMMLDEASVRDITGEVLDDHDRIRVLPAAYWATTTVEERALFGHRHGIYSFPTVELVDHLRTVIGGRTAIEIGAGNGVLAAALGIPATDSRQHEKEPFRDLYVPGRLGPPVRYGDNIIECHASRAVRRYKPQVVIGCWVTWKYDPRRHEAGGNIVGVDDDDILDHCETYVNVGNELVHAPRKIWARPHQIIYPSFLYSRAHNGSREFIATWNGRRPARVSMLTNYDASASAVPPAPRS